MEKSEKSYMLDNGLTLPWISFSTGVIWKYSRNKKLFLKVNLRKALSSVKHLKLNRELKGNLFCKKYLEQAYDVGYRMFDTGRIYGYSEKYIGKTVAQKEGTVLVTKCSAMDVTRSCSPNTVKGNLEISLANLGVDCVDVYLLHWPEGDWLNYYAQIIEQYKAGKCKAYGACNLHISHLKQIEEAGLEPPMIVQTELHPLNSKRELRDYCKEHNILLEAHTPTARGSRELADTDIMRELTAKYNKTSVQITLRWHYQNGVIPVVSTFSKEHMAENLDIFDFELTGEEMLLIEGLNQDKVLLNVTGCYDDDINYVYNL